MTTSPDRTTRATRTVHTGQTGLSRQGALRVPIALAAVTAALGLAVAVIHVIDQGGVPGSKDPSYIGVGYYLLEIVGVAVAVLLLAPRTRHSVLVWSLGLVVGLGPIVGYCLSRGPGLPDYTEARGHWSEPLGLISLLIEVLLLVVSLLGVSRAKASAEETIERPVVSSQI